MKTICYPAAYGFLSARLDFIVQRFGYKCRINDIEISDDALDVLDELIKEAQNEAYNRNVEEH